MATISSGDHVESSLNFEVIDIRRFQAQDFAGLLEAEAQAWGSELHWDFTPSKRVISNYLREKRLLGYALVLHQRIFGYCFFFYDGDKGLIGDLYVEKPAVGLDAVHRLLEHAVETLVATPGLRRVEAQLPHFSFEQLEPCFRQLSFACFRRRFMALSLERSVATVAFRPSEDTTDYWLTPWERQHDRESAEILCETYRGHVDAAINNQYGSLAGTTRLIENIVHHQGCGDFLAGVSRVAMYRATRRIAGILAVTALRSHTAHIPQVAVAKPFQGRGIGTLLMASAFRDLAARGYREVSLTVTDENADAVRLYERLGFETFRAFGAFVFNRP
jgi:ribosomal protein S18 acetylase RimI-like enzyme